MAARPYGRGPYGAGPYSRYSGVELAGVTQISFDARAEMVVMWRQGLPCETGAWNTADCEAGAWLPAGPCEIGTWTGEIP